MGGSWAKENFTVSDAAETDGSQGDQVPVDLKASVLRHVIMVTGIMVKLRSYGIETNAGNTCFTHVYQCLIHLSVCLSSAGLLGWRHVRPLSLSLQTAWRVTEKHSELPNWVKHKSL